MCFTLNSTWRTSTRHSLYGLLHPTMLVSSLGMKQCDMLGASTNSDCAITRCYTVYPKKYAHGFCFAVLCCGYTLTDFPYPSGLLYWHCPSASKATLMIMDKYFMWIHYERLHNHNKAKHNKTVCIFIGIYCRRPSQSGEAWLTNFLDCPH